jgi:sulfofructose kinase
VLVDASGERVIANYPSPDLPAEADWLQDVDFSQWDIVLADVRWHDGAKQAFIRARQQGVPTLLDADVTPQDIAELIALSDHAAFSAPGLRRLTQLDEAEDALKKHKRSQMDMCTLRRGETVASGWKAAGYVISLALRSRWLIPRGRATFSTVRWRSVWRSKRPPLTPCVLPAPSPP